MFSCSSFSNVKVCCCSLFYESANWISWSFGQIIQGICAFGTCDGHFSQTQNMCVDVLAAPTFPSALSPLRMWDGDLWPLSDELEVVLTSMLATMVEGIDTDRLIMILKCCTSYRPVRVLLKPFENLTMQTVGRLREEGGAYVKRDTNKKQTSGGKGAECVVLLTDVSVATSVCGGPQGWRGVIPC